METRQPTPIEHVPAKTVTIQRVDARGNIDPEASFSVRLSDFDQVSVSPRTSIRMSGPEYAFEVSGSNHRVFYGSTNSSPIDLL